MRHSAMLRCAVKSCALLCVLCYPMLLRPTIVAPSPLDRSTTRGRERERVNKLSRDAQASQLQPSATSASCARPTMVR